MYSVQCTRFTFTLYFVYKYVSFRGNALCIHTLQRFCCIVKVFCTVYTVYTLYIHLYFVFKYNVSFRGNAQGSNSGMFFNPAGNKTSVSLRNSMNIVYIYIYIVKCILHKNRLYDLWLTVIPLSWNIGKVNICQYITV